jgi:hypothetical protein
MKNVLRLTVNSLNKISGQENSIKKYELAGIIVTKDGNT